MNLVYVLENDFHLDKETPIFFFFPILSGYFTRPFSKISAKIRSGLVEGFTYGIKITLGPQILKSGLHQVFTTLGPKKLHINFG